MDGRRRRVVRLGDTESGLLAGLSARHAVGTVPGRGHWEWSRRCPCSTEAPFRSVRASGRGPAKGAVMDAAMDPVQRYHEAWRLLAGREPRGASKLLDPGLQ